MTHHLCCMCGTVSPAGEWTFWQAKDDWQDEAEKWRQSLPGEGDPMMLCPACGWEHRDTDDGSGVYDGTLEQMQAQRQADLPEYGDQWTGRLIEARKEAIRQGFADGLRWVRDRFNLDSEDVDALNEAIEKGPWE